MGYANVASAKSAIDFARREPTTLSGRLTFKVFPRPPEFEDVRRGDQPEPSFILELAEKLCFSGGEYSEGVNTFDRVQLIPPTTSIDITDARMRSFLRQHVQVKIDDLFESHTGHHHAPVLGTVMSIESDQERTPSADDEPGMTTVRGFYRALAAGDGQEAATILVPEKRGAGPLSARSLSAFYGTLAEPLRLANVRPLSSVDFEAAYSYRTRAKRCDSRAIVSIARRGGLNLISGIKALNGCWAAGFGRYLANEAGPWRKHLMSEEKELPSDAEKGSLKPRDEKKDGEPSSPPPDDKKAEQDPSEQPS